MTLRLVTEYFPVSPVKPELAGGGGSVSETYLSSEDSQSRLKTSETCLTALMPVWTWSSSSLRSMTAVRSRNGRITVQQPPASAVTPGFAVVPRNPINPEIQRQLRSISGPGASFPWKCEDFNKHMCHTATQLRLEVAYGVSEGARPDLALLRVWWQSGGVRNLQGVQQVHCWRENTDYTRITEKCCLTLAAGWFYLVLIDKKITAQRKTSFLKYLWKNRRVAFKEEESGSGGQRRRCYKYERWRIKFRGNEARHHERMVDLHGSGSSSGSGG